MSSFNKSSSRSLVSKGALTGQANDDRSYTKENTRLDQESDVESRNPFEVTSLGEDESVCVENTNGDTKTNEWAPDKTIARRIGHPR